MTVAVAALMTLSVGDLGGQALASSNASMHGCHRFTVTDNRLFSGQHWTYRVRIQAIKVRGIRCQAVKALVQGWDSYIVSRPGGYNVGVYYTLRPGPWRRRAFRPYAGPNFLQNEDCKKSRGRLIWQEQQLSAKRTG